MTETATPPVLAFEETTVPETVTSRPSEPNPFEGRFPTAEGRALTLSLPYGTDAEKKAVQKIISQAQEAGRAVDTTTRKKMETVDKNGKPSDTGKIVRLTFWSVAKISRPRKSADDAATETPQGTDATEAPAGEDTATE